MENEWFHWKLNILLPCGPAIVLTGSYTEEFTSHVHTKNLHMVVYSIFIYSQANVEEMKASFNRLIVEEHTQVIGYLSWKKRELSSYNRIWSILLSERNTKRLQFNSLTSGSCNSRESKRIRGCLRFGEEKD